MHPELSLASALRTAIDSGEIRLEFQPEFDLRTGEVLAVEALARWDHPALGELQADRFIELAESSGSIVELGAWVLRAACQQYARWREQLPDLDLVIRVNVSAPQLSDRHFVDFVAKTLSDAGMQPTELCLEITERVDPVDPQLPVRTLQALRDLGIHAALDDFGAGRNGLMRLREGVYDILKIDRAFVTSLAPATTDSVLVAAIVKLARELGIEVVAEGIESSTAVQELLRLGCWRGQGYLLGQPVDGALIAGTLVSTSS